MSTILRHRYIVRHVFAVPFLTKHGVGFHYFSRKSILHVHQKVPIISGLKKGFRYPREVPFKPSQSKPDPVNEKPVQTRQNQDGELFHGSVTMGAAPSPRQVPIPMFLR